jgi:hypothetical protein
MSASIAPAASVEVGSAVKPMGMAPVGMGPAVVADLFLNSATSTTVSSAYAPLPSGLVGILATSAGLPKLDDMELVAGY